MKKSALWLLLLPIIFFQSCTKESQKSTALHAIPVGSAIVVRINNLHDFAHDLQESTPAKALQNSAFFAPLDSFVRNLASWQPEEQKTIRAFGGLHLAGASQYSWIWSLASDEIPFISASILQQKGNVESRKYGEHSILHFTNEQLDFYFATHQGVTLLSEKDNLIELALNQMNTKIDLNSDANFGHVLQTVNEKDPANLFVQYNSLPQWLENIVAPGASWTQTFATWSALDLDINTNNMTLTGVSLATDSASTYLGSFRNSGNGNSIFPSIVPQNTALVISQTSGDAQQWHKDFQLHMGRQNKLKNHNNKLTQLGIDPSAWAAICDEEMGVFYTDGALSITESKVGFIRVKNVADAKNALASGTGNFDENYRGINIKKINKNLALPLVFGRLFSHLGEPYYFAFQDFILFSNNLANAKSVINNLLAEKTWENSAAFQNMAKMRDEDAHISVIAHNPEWLKLAEKELHENHIENLKTSAEQFSQVQWILLQFTQKNNAAYSEMVLLHEAKVEAIAKQYWAVDLPENPVEKPFLVKNHHTKNNDILVQDKANNIHLISPNGKLQWQVALDGPIMGEVQQIDMFKNNKYQLVFNTASKVYIIDRLGRHVGEFPIALPKTATAGMAIFDYDNTRSYRLVVPCGKRLYNFNIDGKQVDGWKHKKADAEIKMMPKHDVIGSKDYIYFADAEGHVYLLNRRGEVRLPIESTLPPLASELHLVYDKNIGGKLSALSKQGSIINLLMSDAIDSLQPFGNDPIYMAQTEKTQAFAAKNELYVRSETHNFDVDFEEDINVAPAVYMVNGSPYIAVSTEDDQVWIFNSQGNPLPGMPIFGAGTAVVGKTAGKGLHVIVANPEGALIDYQLEE